MPFNLPDDVTPGLRSKNTIAIYKSRLNKLATAGFDNVEALLKKPKDVIKVINEMHFYEDAKMTKNKRLEMLTGVMYALSATANDNKKKLQYKKAFDSNKTTYTSPAEIRKTDPEYKSKKEI
jgi:hypothetical protein